MASNRLYNLRIAKEKLANAEMANVSRRVLEVLKDDVTKKQELFTRATGKTDALSMFD